MPDNNKNSNDVAANSQKIENESHNFTKDESNDESIDSKNSSQKDFDKVKDSKTKYPSIPTIESKPKEINYQISLVDENRLKVVVLTKKGVKINSLIRERSGTIETQSNEIYLYPKTDFGLQEIEILIAIENIENKNSTNLDEISEIENSEPAFETQVPPSEPSSKGNYQINLINENLLRIKVETDKGVKIDTIIKEKKTSAESQSNKIYLKPKSNNELQEIEITLEIEEEKNKDVIGATKEGQLKLIPNPEVVDLIQPPDYSDLIKDTTDISDTFDVETGLRNPFEPFKKLIRRNIIIGIIIAIALHVVAATVVYFNLSKGSNAQEPEEQSRLIVIQDLPDPKIKLEDVEDPNKPKVEEVPPIEIKEEPKREITPRKTVRPPRVLRPETESEDKKQDTALGSDLTRELDSLRRLVEGNISDTTLMDTVRSTYEIPDSLRNSFNENDIGLAMYFPKNWKIIDQRDINKEEKNFKGVILTDTTAEQSGTMNMFIHLDPDNKEYNAEDFQTEFPMNDSNLNAFSKEPKTLAGFTEYKFYIFNKLGTEKLSLKASVRKQFFDQYKNEIEAVVRSISIRKKEDL